MAFDYVIVGSGINGLVAAALLGKKGRKVLLLERNERIGGCIRTEEITAPGFVHDVMATTFVLFVTSPAYGALGADLAARGLEFAHSPYPTGVLLPDGRHQIFSMDRARNIAAFEALAAGDGARYGADMERLGADAPFLFSLLGGSLWSWGMLKIVAREGWKRGPRGLAAFFGQALTTARGWLEQHYRSTAVPCALGALGSAYRPWAGERLFRSDVKSDRLRAGGRRRADRQGRRAQSAARVRNADQRPGRRNPHLGGCRIDRARRFRRGARRQARRRRGDRGAARRHLFGDAESALWTASSRRARAQSCRRIPCRLSLRQRRYANPLRLETPAEMARSRTWQKSPSCI